MRSWWTATVTVAPSSGARGQITVPGDKSISHRYALLAALADGESIIHGYSPGMDCLATLACIQAIGASVEHRAESIVVGGCGVDGIAVPAAPLDAANSGTTMRLLAGVLAAQPFTSVLTGDESLSRRPMRRIITPLTMMGGKVEAQNGHPPLTVHGRPLRGIAYVPDVPSAQVKSCVLLAGLFASGRTTVREALATRDHTERALETFGVAVERDETSASVSGGSRLVPQELRVPGDVSGAAFWCALAAATPGGDITIDNVGLNPGRTAFLDVLGRAGADVVVTPEEATGSEPCGSIRVRHRAFSDVTIDPAEVPGVIDEIPALAAMAAMMPAGRTFTVRGAAELRVKESDRIATLAAGFRRMGSEVEEYDDGFTLRARPLQGADDVHAAGDHRLAMAFMVAATRAAAPVTIHGVAVEVSYPGFHDTFALLTGHGDG